MEVTNVDIRDTAPRIIAGCNACILGFIRELSHEKYSIQVRKPLGSLSCDICTNEIQHKPGACITYRHYPCSMAKYQLIMCTDCSQLAGNGPMNEDAWSWHRVTATTIINFREQLQQCYTRAYDIFAYMSIIAIDIRASAVMGLCTVCGRSLSGCMQYTYLRITPSGINAGNVLRRYYELCSHCHEIVCARTQDLYICGRVLLTVLLLVNIPNIPMDICMVIYEYVRELIIRRAAEAIRE